MFIESYPAAGHSTCTICLAPTQCSTTWFTPGPGFFLLRPLISLNQMITEEPSFICEVFNKSLSGVRLENQTRESQDVLTPEENLENS